MLVFLSGHITVHDQFVNTLKINHMDTTDEKSPLSSPKRCTHSIVDQPLSLGAQGSNICRLEFWGKSQLDPVTKIDAFRKAQMQATNDDLAEFEWRSNFISNKIQIKCTKCTAISNIDPNNATFYALLVSTLTLNLIAAIIMFCSTDFQIYHQKSQWLIISLVNFNIGLLFRIELFVKQLYVCVGKFPFDYENSEYSMKCKMVCHRMVINIGSIHVGCMTCGYIQLLIAAFIELFTYFTRKNANTLSLVSVILLFVIAILLTVVMVFAPHCSRFKYHDWFEVTHRYLVYISLILIWLYYVVNYTINMHSIVLGCLVSILSIMSVIPWLSLRKVAVEYRLINKNVIEIQFEQSMGVSHVGAFGRISIDLCCCGSNISQWHAFASTMNDIENNKHSFLISKAGDWTSNLIDKYNQNILPNYIWTRTFENYGFMYFASTYKSVQFVATGAGIAPVMAYYCLSNKNYKNGKLLNIKLHTLWMAPSPQQNFQSIVKILNNYGNTNVIYDTRKYDRPDLEKAVRTIVRMTKSQAVFCVANQKVTQMVIQICHQRNIPVYGAVWDS